MRGKGNQVPAYLMNKEQIGEVLKKRAESSGISGYSLAQATGIDTGTINRILTGKREPGVINFLRICKVLRMEIKDFQ